MMGQSRLNMNEPIKVNFEDKCPDQLQKLKLDILEIDKILSFVYLCTWIDNLYIIRVIHSFKNLFLVAINRNLR